MLRVLLVRICPPVCIFLIIYGLLPLLLDDGTNSLLHTLISFVVVVVDVIQGILFVVNQAVEESNHAFGICAHEGEKLWHDVALVLLDLDLVGEHKLKEHIDVVSALVHTEKHFGILVVHVAELGVVAIEDVALGEASDEEVLD